MTILPVLVLLNKSEQGKHKKRSAPPLVPTDLPLGSAATQPRGRLRRPRTDPEPLRGKGALRALFVFPNHPLTTQCLQWKDFRENPNHPLTCSRINF